MSVFIAAASLISALVAPYSEPAMPSRPVPLHSADVPDEFLRTLMADCGPSGLQCRPIDLIGCWLHESGLSPRAHNGIGAAGFFQVMPVIARGLGFRGDVAYREPAGAYVEAVKHLEDVRAHGVAGGSELAAATEAVRALDAALSSAFARLSLIDQLAWAYRYYKPHAGQLVNPGACYAANFVPGLLAHAAEPSFVICASNGRASWAMDRDPAKASARSRDWYRQNVSLDADNDGAITMGDLATTAARALSRERGVELAARLEAMTADPWDLAPPETQPEVASAVDVTDGGADLPVHPPIEPEAT